MDALRREQHADVKSQGQAAGKAAGKVAAEAWRQQRLLKEEEPNARQGKQVDHEPAGRGTWPSPVRVVIERVRARSDRRRVGDEVDDSRPTLTVEETAKLLGISRGLAFQAVRRGDIPAIRIGRRILVPLTQLQALLNGDGAYAPAAPSAGTRRDTSG